MEYVASLSILACIVAKLVLSTRAKQLQKRLEADKAELNDARQAFRSIEAKAKLLEAEFRQLDSKQTTIQKHIDGGSKKLKGYAAKEQEEKAKSIAQQQLMRAAKKE